MATKILPDAHGLYSHDHVDYDCDRVTPWNVFVGSTEEHTCLIMRTLILQNFGSFQTFQEMLDKSFQVLGLFHIAFYNQSKSNVYKCFILSFL
mmetsp:Transcript_8930/g.16844  ORF Transcript_8930/g.16844 Transcript_8930/m.16844 type:complete len:93 (+) Transcript_8930:814-1092(+)